MNSEEDLFETHSRELEGEGEARLISGVATRRLATRKKCVRTAANARAPGTAAARGGRTGEEEQQQQEEEDVGVGAERGRTGRAPAAAVAQSRGYISSTFQDSPSGQH